MKDEMMKRFTSVAHYHFSELVEKVEIKMIEKIVSEEVNKFQALIAKNLKNISKDEKIDLHEALTLIDKMMS